MKNRVWGSIWTILGIASVTMGILSAWDTIRSRSFAPTLSSLGWVAWVRHYDLRGELLLILAGILLLLTAVTLFLLPKRRFAVISAEPAEGEVVPVPAEEVGTMAVSMVAEPRIACYLRTRLVGSTFLNTDGSSRQSILAGTSEGDILICRTQTYRYAPDTIGIFTVHGKQVGQLDAAFTRTLREQYPNHRIGVCVEALRGGDGLPYICDLRVAVYRN